MYMRALLLLRRPPCWNTYGVTRRRRNRDVSRRDVNYPTV